MKKKPHRRFWTILDQYVYSSLKLPSKTNIIYIVRAMGSFDFAGRDNLAPRRSQELQKTQNFRVRSKNREPSQQTLNGWGTFWKRTHPTTSLLKQMQRKWGLRSPRTRDRWSTSNASMPRLYAVMACIDSTFSRAPSWKRSEPPPTKMCILSDAPRSNNPVKTWRITQLLQLICRMIWD